MNFVISIINPEKSDAFSRICNEMKLPLILSLYGRGTATRSMLEMLGLNSADKRVVMTIANTEQTGKLLRAERERLYIDAPGHGIAVSVPVKSVGGGKNLAILSGGQPEIKPPELNFDYELLIAVTGEGHTDEVMDAARAAGAGGGTVLHAKGSGAAYAEKFLNVSLTHEREMMLIVTKKEIKAAIMTSILKACPQNSVILFSLPVSDAAGFQFSK